MWVYQSNLLFQFKSLLSNLAASDEKEVKFAGIKTGTILPE
jgi:hypothetical protein